jgi:hypothetical protein
MSLLVYAPFMHSVFLTSPINGRYIGMAVPVIPVMVPPACLILFFYVALTHASAADICRGKSQSDCAKISRGGEANGHQGQRHPCPQPSPRVVHCQVDAVLICKALQPVRPRQSRRIAGSAVNRGAFLPAGVTRAAAQVGSTITHIEISTALATVLQRKYTRIQFLA